MEGLGGGLRTTGGGGEWVFFAVTTRSACEDFRMKNGACQNGTIQLCTQFHTSHWPWLYTVVGLTIWRCRKATRPSSTSATAASRSSLRLSCNSSAAAAAFSWRGTSKSSCSPMLSRWLLFDLNVKDGRGITQYKQTLVRITAKSTCMVHFRLRSLMCVIDDQQAKKKRSGFIDSGLVIREWSLYSHSPDILHSPFGDSHDGHDGDSPERGFTVNHIDLLVFA